VPVFLGPPDRNGNSTGCGKSVPGNGNTGEGKNYKDDIQPQ
jgi:hypothetical protein